MPTTITWAPKNNSNSWNTTTNWSLGRLPESTDNVVVAGSPVIAGSGYADNLEINSGTVSVGGSVANQQSSLIVDGSITNKGQISINPGATKYSSTLEFDLPGMLAQSILSGGGTILLSDSPLNFIESGPNGVKLVNEDNTIKGAGQFGNGGPIKLDNQAQGLIEATQPTNQLTISMSQTATNEGTIEALASSKGLTIYRTTIDSSGGGTVSAAGSNVYLSGATLIGGTMDTSGNGVFQTVGSGNVINAVDNTGTIDVPDATSLTLKGVITNNGNINVQAGDDQTYLNVDATGATLNGPGFVTLSDSSHNVIFGSGNPSTLNNVANLISGAGTIGGNGLVVNNAGVITATGVNNPLVIATGGVFTNNGILSATGPAGLQIQNTTVNGALGGQIIANAPNAVVELIAAHLTGGTLSTTGLGAAIEAIGQNSILDGTLTNVTNNGTVQVGAGATLQVWGTIKNTGNFAINGASLGEADLTAGLVGATLTGGGTVTLSASSNSSISGEGSSDFTNQNNTISGAGSITDMTLTNGGTIDATSASTALQIHTTNAVTNNGILEANAGTLDVLDAVTGSGTALITRGGTMSFSAAFGENVAFQGPGNLVLSAAYAGTISGLAVGDSVDLADLSYKSNYIPVWSSSGTLSIEDSSNGDVVVASLKLSGGYVSGDFSLSNDNGETLIKVVSPAVSSDFNGDGTSDILYRNNGNGDTGFYQINNGANLGWSDVGASSTAYNIVGTGDFYGNGSTDILYRDNATGHTGFYQINNGANLGWHDIGASSTAYSVVGVGDFTGSGTDDILYRNDTTGDTGFYQMVNGINVGWHDVGASSTAYSVVGVGDFLGTGTDDILYRNITSGDTGFYAISNGVNTGWHDIGASSTAYSVVGVGDFMGTGTDDILYRSNATGDTGFYAISNGVNTGWHDIGASSTAYSVVGVGDYLGNGSSDILYRNNTTGDTGFYAIVNGVNTGWHDVGVSPSAYHVVS